MNKWLEWTKIADGPFQGTPQLSTEGLGASGYVTLVRDMAGNANRVFPAEPDIKKRINNLGGAGIIAGLPGGHTRIGGSYATGSDKCLYRQDYERDQTWRKVAGPGRFLSAVYSSVSIDGYAEVFGEGVEHQLAYALVTPEENRQFTIHQWEDLGRPGEAGGMMGVNGRPAILHTGSGVHALVRGQDNHLWHIFRKGANPQMSRTFGPWTNLGGGLSQVPVVSQTGNGLECFVVGEKNELYINSFSGAGWSGFENLGGQVKGLPAALHLPGSGSTYVFVRGVHDQLWYRQRSGKTWQAWQSVGDNLAGEPAVWDEPMIDADGGRLSCVVLRQKGELWSRALQLSADEYSGKQALHAPR